MHATVTCRMCPLSAAAHCARGHSGAPALAALAVSRPPRGCSGCGMLLTQRIAENCSRRPGAPGLFHVAAASGGGFDDRRRRDPEQEPPPAAQAADGPDFKLVYGEGPATLTYGRLHQLASRVAAGLPAGCTVAAVLLDEAPASVVAELGVLYSGAAFVPLDAGSPIARLRYQLGDCAASAAIHARAQAPRVRALLAAPEDLAAAVQAFALEELLSVPGTGDDSEPAHGGCGLGASSSFPRPVQPADASHIIYTSGTTGAPKGVVCEHSALMHYADAKLAAHGISAEARVLLVSATTWDPSGAFCGGALPLPLPCSPSFRPSWAAVVSHCVHALLCFAADPAALTAACSLRRTHHHHLLQLGMPSRRWPAARRWSRPRGPGWSRICPPSCVRAGSHTSAPPRPCGGPPSAAAGRLAGRQQQAGPASHRSEWSHWAASQSRPPWPTNGYQHQHRHNRWRRCRDAGC
eukprot:SAG22_NODE_330_length_12211_cov_6.451948_2_plen_465_part_00